MNALAHNNIRLGLRVGGIGVLLLATWLCRAKPEYPVSEGDAMFRVRALQPAACLATVVVHTPENMGRLSLPTDGDYMEDEFGGVASRPQNPMQDSFTPRAPTIVIPRSHDDSSDRRGLFDLNTLDPAVERDSDSGSGGWGWLADEVNASTPDPFERLSTGRSAESQRRYFDDDNDDKAFGRGFQSGSGSGSENGAYFRRQDRRF